nr:hypothetical protein [Sphingobacterium multivorum]
MNHRNRKENNDYNSHCRVHDYHFWYYDIPDDHRFGMEIPTHSMVWQKVPEPVLLISAL